MAAHLYVHVPFCDGKCHYCGFYSSQAEPSQIRRYAALPAAELSLLLARRPALARDTVTTLYFGGGTPALLGPDGLAALAASLARLLPLDRVEEWTVELNPSSVTADLLGALKRMGVTRLSLGVQGLDDETLARIGRRHTAAQALDALALARRAGFSDLGIDLIAGLPGVTPPQWLDTVKRAAEMGLTHLSVYALSVEPGTALARQVNDGLDLPGDDAQLDALSAAEASLCAAGFQRYEISNYARPGFECRHNLGVWRGSDYLGLGPAAASRVEGLRWTNLPDLTSYDVSLSAGGEPPRDETTLDAIEDACERCVFALRLAEGYSPDQAARRYPAMRDRAVEQERRLRRLSELGLVERKEARWTLTARGREVCDAVIKDLL